MTRRPIHTDQAPKAIGPYSQAIECSVPRTPPAVEGTASAPTEAKGGRLVFCSGQIPLDPRTGELVAGDIAAQTEQVMKNLEAVLKAAGMGFQNVVRTTIFLMDLGEFAKVNEVYGRRFPKEPPARVTIQAAGLPKGAQVEIDAIAVG